MKKLMVLVLSLSTMLLTVAPAAAAQLGPKLKTEDVQIVRQSDVDGGDIGQDAGVIGEGEDRASTPQSTIPTGESIVAIGVLEKPEITTYMYGTHAITDEVSGTRYALRSEDVGLLDSYVGQKVSIYGESVPGYENGQVEGGPPLLNVTWVQLAS